MSTKTVAEAEAGRRSMRKATKELTPEEGLPGSILFASALKKHARKHRTEVPRHKAAARQIAPPDFAKLQSLAQGGFLSRIFSWFRERVGAASSKELRLAETVQLGDKRFVAIIHVEGRKFLIGGGTGGVNLLTQLDEPA